MPLASRTAPAIESPSIDCSRRFSRHRHNATARQDDLQYSEIITAATPRPRRPWSRRNGVPRADRLRAQNVAVIDLQPRRPPHDDIQSELSIVGPLVALHLRRGHTGTLNSAVSCLWLLDRGRTSVTAAIAGSSPSKGTGICDRVVSAAANDPGLDQGQPRRTPSPSRTIRPVASVREQP